MPAPFPGKAPDKAFTSGGIAAFLAFLIWGCLPLYWKALNRMDALEILCHRVAWSFLTMLPVILCSGRTGQVLAILGSRKKIFILTGSSLILACNWLLFIWAVNSGRVLETSLGYFINPLINILLGMFLFRERISRVAWIAISLATAGVLNQVTHLGHPPWVALGLGCSFALYGLIRKVAPVEALPGLFIETFLGLPFALIWLFLQGMNGMSVLYTADVPFLLLLASSGALTAAPLFLFAFGVRRLRLTSLGLLQYVSPSMTFLQGLFLFNEPFSPNTFLTFACIWTALALYTWDSFRRNGAREEKA